MCIFRVLHLYVARYRYGYAYAGRVYCCSIIQQLPWLAMHGMIREFDQDWGDWMSYCECREQSFMANDVDNTGSIYSNVQQRTEAMSRISFP